jgi:hypothetical protein
VLVVDEPVEPADVIVLPKWAGAAGAIDASDLVHRGIASRVALLPEPPKPAEEELIRRRVPYVDENADLVQLLRALGVATVDIIPEPAAGTEAEGQALLSWCNQHTFRSMIVVSSPDHSRRVRRVLHRAMRGHSTKVLVRSARWSLTSLQTDGGRLATGRERRLSAEALLDLVRHPI